MLEKKLYFTNEIYSCFIFEQLFFNKENMDLSA